MEQTTLECSSIDPNGIDTKMFTIGKRYTGDLTGYNDCAVMVVDNLGHNRFINLVDLSFIVRNDANINNPFATYRAHFTIIED